MRVWDVPPQNVYADNLRKAVNRVFESDDPSGADFDLAQSLRANVSRFGSYKQYHVAEAIRRVQAAESDEKIRDARIAGIIHTARQRQRTEFNTAVSRSRTAKQFAEFSDDDSRRLFPNLRWVPSRSTNPREEHMHFWNRVWSKDDPFWSVNQPGNVWNCTCDMEETDDDTTDNGGVPAPEPVRGLAGNPAITGEVFSGDASYFQGVSNTRGRQIQREMVESVRSELIARMKPLAEKKIEIQDGLPAVEFNQKSIYHLVNDTKYSADGWLNAEILPYLDSYIYISREKIVAHEKNVKRDKKPNATDYYYMEIEINGKKRYLALEDTTDPVNGRRLLAYSITDRVRESATWY